MNFPPNVILEDVDCPLGCRRNDEAILTGRDRLHDLPGVFTVVKCRTCGLMRTNPRPTADTIGFYYPEDYHPYRITRVKQSSKQGYDIKTLLKPWVNRLLPFNITCLPSLAPGRMLEVGCASGIFIHQLAQKGWHVSGIEFSAQAAENARSPGYPVHTGPLETAPRPEAPLDLVVGWMVLEHLQAPVLALRKLHRWTKPGGWLALSVPNARSLEFHFFKDRWYALSLPTHLYHFTPGSLVRVLREGGWTVERIFHQRELGNLAASLGYMLQDRGVLPSVAAILVEFPKRSNVGHYLVYPMAYVASLLGQTGRMTVWARRTG